jgi:hypothetical protein
MAATAGQADTSGPPFPLGKTTWKPWKERALARIGEQRFMLTWLHSLPDVTVSDSAVKAMTDHWETACVAAKSRWWRRGGVVERVTSHLDAVDTDLLRLAPDTYVYGQLPGLLAQVKLCLAEDDLRRTRIERLAKLEAPLPEQSSSDRDLIVATHHAAASERRRQVTRLRSFKNVILVTSAVLALGAGGLAVFGIVAPEKLPLCFNPGDNIVCPTSTHNVLGESSQEQQTGQPGSLDQAVVEPAMRRDASEWDIPLVELVGLLAAAIAAATSLRKIRGTSTPFSLPVALAVLKLPTGALTAVFGILLMRGEFVPGLTALDSSAQIVAWAVVLGYSQQLLTRFVDQRAQTVLENFGRARTDQEQAHARVDPAPASV